MTLRTFLFAADALRLEEGVDWVMAPQAGSSVPASSPDSVKRQNATAMAQLQGILGGVKKR
jgi:hypothetical protein